MMTKCRFCKSEKVVKSGKRYNARDSVQVYLCRGCNRRFTVNDGFLKMRYSKDVISASLDLYAKGLALRKIQDFLYQFFQVKPNQSTILRWVRKYAKLISKYTKTLKLDSVKTIHADETGLYFKKNLNWLWNVIDADSRFLMGASVTRFRWMSETAKVFRECKDMIPNDPERIITDGLHHYSGAKERVFPGSEHIRLISFSEKPNNNMIESFNRTIKERTKVMHGFKSYASARDFMSCWQTWYNFIRPHEGLGGKTPAEMAGIDLKLDGNKWLRLIERSIKQA